MLTSLAVVVPDPGPEGLQLVRTVTEWAPPEFRVEFVVIGDSDPVVDEADRGAVGSGEVGRQLDQLVWTWGEVSGSGGRAEVLDRASDMASGEFLVLATGSPSFAALPAGLSHMWVSASDAMLIGAEGPDLDATDVKAQAEMLSRAVGLRAGARPGVIVVLRRWVARFLFNELGLAIDAGEEFEERVGLLELRLALVADGPGR